MSTPLELRVTPARTDDTDEIAVLHARAFPAAAMTAFGHEAVRRYYLWLLQGPHDAKVMLAWRGSKLIGFCASGRFSQAVRGFLRKNVVFLAGRVLRHPSLLGNELIRSRISIGARILFRRRTKSAPTSRAPVSRSFGVLSIATDPAVRGSGAGRALMMEAEQRARRERYDRMVLTVHPSNAGAIRFYEQLGWHRSVEHGPWQGAMEKPLSAAQT